MVKITCICGHTADCGAFISAKSVDRWFRCPVCQIKISSPRSVREIGIQIINGNIRSEIIPQPVTASDRADLEIRTWMRDKTLKADEEKAALKSAQMPLWKQQLEYVRNERRTRFANYRVLV